ncbi:MAG: hypothetical protein DMF88_13500 [Acidobacteria bacterium]|nr:MAG: hypothetical protein DMF88_13500 [Acidobacteriota bacterium]
MKTRRTAHQSRSTVGFALFAGRFILRGVPRLGDAETFGAERDADDIALRRRDHPPPPVFGDDRDPVAGRIERRRRFRRRRTTRASSGSRAAPLCEQAHCKRRNKREGDWDLEFGIWDLGFQFVFPVGALVAFLSPL